MDLRRQSKRVEDDIISYCGSMSGETFSSRRRRQHCSLRQHSIDSLAQRLRTQSIDFKSATDQPGDDESYIKRRFNTSFHHLRFLIVMMGGFSLGAMMTLRYNITVAILNMVNQTALYMEEHPNRTIEDFLDEGYSLGGDFDWDNEIQHMIMSWYMIAYTLPQVPCTRLGIKIGSRLATPISLFICAVSTVLTPMMAFWGWEWVIGLRMINGIGASAILPMMLNLIENWMPYDEISLGLTYAQMLTAIMVAANPLVAGYLSSIHWKYAFYVPGTVSFAFCILWIIIVTDRPDDNWLISSKEVDVICGCAQETICHKNPIDCKTKGCNDQNNKNQSDKDVGKNRQQAAVPWTKAFKVPSLYIYIFIWCFYCSSYSCFSFILPTYLRQFLKVKVSQNGFFCFVVQSGSLVSIFWPHPLLRLLENKFHLSMTASRRVLHAIICFMCALTWCMVGAFHQWQLLLLFLNRCFHSSNDIVVTGCLMANFAPAGISSIVFSIVNTVGNLTIVFSSTFIGYLLDYTGQAVEGWSWILYGLGVSQLIMFITFATLIDSNPINFDSKNKNESDFEKGAIPVKSTSGVPDDVIAPSKGHSPLNKVFDKVNSANPTGRDD